MPRLSRRDRVRSDNVSLNLALFGWRQVTREPRRALATLVVDAAAAATDEVGVRKLPGARPPATRLYRSVANLPHLRVEAEDRYPFAPRLIGACGRGNKQHA